MRYEYECASPVCHDRLSAPTEEELVSELSAHLRGKHRVATPPRSMLRYLENTAVRAVDGAGR